MFMAQMVKSQEFCRKDRIWESFMRFVVDCV